MTLVSLLLCVAVAALWVRSYWKADLAGWLVADGVGHKAYSVGSSKGVVKLSYRHDPHYPPDQEPGFFRSWEVVNPRPTRIFVSCGAGYEGYQRSGRPDGPLAFGTESMASDSETFRAAWVPHWPIALLAGLLPLRWLVRAVGTKRAWKAGHCPACGYDLRASSGQCPECGAAAGG